MKMITLLAGLITVTTVLLADHAFAEHSPEHVQAGSDGSAHEDFPQSASGDPCLDPNYPRQTPDGCQASELPDVRTAPSARIPQDKGIVRPREQAPRVSPSANSATQYQYATPGILPATGGPSLIALGTGILFAGGVLIVRRIR
jgi:hypothetical protein